MFDVGLRAITVRERNGLQLNIPVIFNVHHQATVHLSTL
jgi:hypothetical protein